MEKDDFLYQTVYDELRSQIRQGDFPPGSLLPPPEKLTERFGVSRITVTRALRLLAEEGLIRRVQGKGSVVEKPAVRQISRKKTGAIGVIIEHMSSPFGLDMMYQLDLCAQELGYYTLVRFSYGSIEKEAAEIEYLMSLGIEGLVIMPCHGLYYNQQILKLYLEGFPVVIVDKTMQGIHLPSVRTDNVSAVRILVRKLAEEGCRRIAYISSEETNVTSVRERRKGFIEGIDSCAAAEAGILLLPLKSTREDFLSNTAQGERTQQKIREFLLSGEGRIDGVICGEYSLLLPLLRAIGSLPGQNDLRIATIDSDPLAPGGYPYMHMKQDERAIARKAVELLRDQLKGHSASAADHLIPSIFVPADE